MEIGTVLYIITALADIIIALIAELFFILGKKQRAKAIAHVRFVRDDAA